MTLVLSRLQPLNGSDQMIRSNFKFFSIALLIFSCSILSMGMHLNSSNQNETSLNIPKNGDKKGKQDTIVQKIALILPFYLDSLDLYNLETPIFAKSEMAVSFYEGALMALDSLKNLGWNVDLFVYDSKNDTSKVKEIISEPEMLDMDLIIGPVFKPNVRIVAKFALENEIPTFSPLTTIKQFDKHNPYFTMLTPSMKTHCNNLMRHIFNNYRRANFLMIASPSLQPDELIFADCVKQSFGYVDSLPDEANRLKIYNGSPSNVNAISTLLDTGINVIIIPSLDESLVYYNFSNLKKIVKKHKIIIFGLPLWLKFESIDLTYFNVFQVNLSSSFWVDYDSTRIVDFRVDYMNKHNNEPSKFVYKGYDTFFMIGKLCLNYGPDLVSEANDFTYLGFCSSYNLMPVYVNGYINRYENGYVNILKFDEFNLIKIND